MDKEELLEEWEALAERWGLVAAQVVEYLQACQSRLCRRSETAEMNDVRFLQGQVEVMRRFINLPETRITELKKEVYQENDTSRRRHSRG